MLNITPNWWTKLSPAWKVSAAILTGIPSVAAAWKPITSTWDWWIARYDSSVLEFLRGRENVARAMSGFVVPEPTLVTFIAQNLKRKPQRVHRSLLRLERKDRVHRELGGWQFGPTPLRPNTELARWKAQ
jgi:hypothetical protein